MIKLRRTRWAGYVARKWEGSGEAHTGCWRENLRERENLEDNIKMDVQEVGWESMDRIELA